MANDPGEMATAYADLLRQLPPATNVPTNCRHEGFGAVVCVARVEDVGEFVAEVRIVCIACHLPFRFKGAPAGMAYSWPTVSIDGTELHAPIEPEYEKQLRAEATYHVGPTPPTKH